MKPLITVIVPVYNAEKYLNRCIASIVNQTYKNLEIILVDDGSPDNCPQMCDDWAEKDSRIKVIHKENGGVSSARNAALDMVQGEYIGFVDSDDYIAENMYEKLQESIKDAEMCTCNITLLDDSGELISSTNFESMVLTDSQIIIKFLDSHFFDSFAACDKLYKTSIITKYNLRFSEDIRCGEDYLFNYWYLKKINKMVSIKDNLYFYIKGVSDSLTYGMTYEKAMRWRIVKEFVLNEKNNADTLPIALTKYQSELICCLKELLRSRHEELINECYGKICDEINIYAKQFLRTNISILYKLSIILICINRNLFKNLYHIYRK